MRFCEVSIELTSPVVVTRRRTERGYLSPLPYIPATMVRGAMLSSLHYMGLLDEEWLKRESRSPTFYASPAYPLDRLDRSYPSHIFAYKCKIPHGEQFERSNYAGEVLERLEANKEPVFRYTCSEGHAGSLREPHPDPVIPTAGSFREVELEYEHVICVGMSSSRAASKRQLLYDYEAIAAGQRFWFRIAGPDEVVDAMKVGMDVRVGRGISRGYGAARLIEIREAKIGEIGEEIREIYSGKTHMALYSLSHILSTNPSPDSILEIDLEGLAGVCGFQAAGKLRVKRIYGRRCSLQLGWDLMRGRRPTVSPAWMPGSIAIAEVKGLDGEWWKALAALAWTGTLDLLLDQDGGIWPIVGINFLEPLALSPMLGECT